MMSKKFLYDGQLGDHLFYFEISILLYMFIFLEIVFRWWSINLCI